MSGALGTLRALRVFVLDRAGRVRRAVLRAARRAVAVLHELTGEGAYRAYCEHRARTHPGEPVISERDFWREHYASQDRDPGARCC